jgi:hypothetical protein
VISGPSSVAAGMFSSVIPRPSSMVSRPSSMVLGASSVIDGTSFVVAGLPSVTSRWIREDHRRGSSDRDGPDGKRNARAAMHSSKHETLLDCR